MCGIVVAVDERGGLTGVHLRPALQAIAHRGPDGQGVWTAAEGRAALGHVRLAIVDVAGGAQPMVSADGRHVLVANGEFYDDQRIRARLTARGHAIATHSDSEIALHLWRELGPACLEQLRGEFAFAVWDEREQRLIAARDRFGIKPLFYAQRGRQLWLASEVKALRAIGIGGDLDDTALFDLLHGCQTGRASLFAGVSQVPPGHYLTFCRGKLEISSYWQANFPRVWHSPRVSDSAEAVQGVRAQLDEAVGLRLRSDVPMACYVSGGIDSSAVLGVASRLAGRALPAFTVAFTDDSQFDESAVARRSAQALGGDFHAVEVDRQAMADALQPAVVAAESLQLNGHAPARWLLSKAVSAAGYKVVLGGEGADEAYVGYHFTHRALRRTGGSPLATVRAIGRAVGHLLAPEDHSHADLQALSPLLARLVRLAGVDPGLTATLATRAHLLRGLLHPEFVQRHRGRDPFARFLRAAGPTQWLGCRPHHALLHLWLSGPFPNYVLGGERLDMAHAVEMRLPFLDHALFAHAHGVAPGLLYAGDLNKVLLRHAAAADVTAEVRSNPKRPFFAPPTAFSAPGPLHTLLQDLLHSTAVTTSPHLSASAVRAFVAGYGHRPVAEQGSLEPVLWALASYAILARGAQS